MDMLTAELRSLDTPDDPGADAAWATEIQRRIESISALLQYIYDRRRTTWFCSGLEMPRPRRPFPAVRSITGRDPDEVD